MPLFHDNSCRTKAYSHDRKDHFSNINCSTYRFSVFYNPEQYCVSCYKSCYTNNNIPNHIVTFHYPTPNNSTSNIKVEPPGMPG